MSRSTLLRCSRPVVALSFSCTIPGRTPQSASRTKEFESLMSRGLVAGRRSYPYHPDQHARHTYYISRATSRALAASVSIRFASSLRELVVSLGREASKRGEHDEAALRADFGVKMEKKINKNKSRENNGPSIRNCGRKPF